MSTLTKTVNNAVVFYDSTYTSRWYDAIGPSVAKYLQQFVNLPVDDTTGDPTEFVNTITEAGGGGDSTATLTDAAGGALLITTDNAENDGYRMQLGGGGGGESVLLDAAYPLYLCLKFAISDVDQTDVLFGVTVTDTDALGAVTDGLYIRSVDESAVLSLVMEKNSVETVTAIQTMVDNTTYTVEVLYDGASVFCYVDGTQVAELLDDAPTFPNDEEMRLTLEFLTGAAAAVTLTVYEMRMIHLRG